MLNGFLRKGQVFITSQLSAYSIFPEKFGLPLACKWN